MWGAVDKAGRCDVGRQDRRQVSAWALKCRDRDVIPWKNVAAKPVESKVHFALPDPPDLTSHASQIPKPLQNSGQGCWPGGHQEG